MNGEREIGKQRVGGGNLFDNTNLYFPAKGRTEAQKHGE